MKLKKLLRFYYSADSLNSALDNIIKGFAAAAATDVYRGCEYYFGKIAVVVEKKVGLSGLWRALDGIISKMSARDWETLGFYARLRTGTARLEEGVRREIHRAVVKFARRAGTSLDRFSAETDILNEYYCLISPEPK